MIDTNTAEIPVTPAPQKESRPRGLFLIFILFLVTGAAGLIYQVVWQRYLLNVFGSTIYSISTVLSAFMGGLALGSLLFGRIADNSRNPLRIYGIIEILIGVSALAVPFLLRLMDPIFTAAYQNFGSNFFAYSILRFVFVFLILLIPTTMMGGSLPLLARFVAPLGARAGLRVGLLYALNTMGAVLGTIVSGFYLVRLLGVQRTVLVAVAINVIAGVLALLIARKTGEVAVKTSPEADPADARVETLPPDAAAPAVPVDPSTLRWVYLSYGISGFAALALEVVWSRALVFTFDLLKNTTYSFTAMLAVFLIGLAAGSAVMTPFADRHKHPFRLFCALQVLIGLTSIASFFVLYNYGYTLGDRWFREFDESSANIRWNAALALVFLRTAATMFIPTFCMGLAFPVAVRVVTSAGGATGRNVGRLYAVNTLGAIFGAALTGFLLLPVLGIARTIFFMGAIQLIIGTYLLVSAKETTPVQRTTWGALALLALLITFPYRGAVFHPIGERDSMIFYKEGPLATVSVVENTLKHRTIYVDNVGVAGTDPMLLTDQKSLAHVPMLLLPNPNSALTVGFGSGGASFSYTLHPELQNIHCVEITKTVVEAAPTLGASNHGVVRRRAAIPPAGPGAAVQPLWEGDDEWVKFDPRFELILDDARSYLRFSQKKYDIIATDCTDLRYKSNANLYDLEYFQLTRDHITKDGMVVVWMPLAGLSEEAFKVALRTFYRVFPHMEVFYMNNEPTHYILMIGTHDPLQIDVNVMRKRLANQAVAKDLAELFLDSPEKIISCFIVGRERLGEMLKGETLNTEDYPYLEFESPRYGYGDIALLDNLELLMKSQENPNRLLTATADAAFRTSLAKYHAAARDIIKGHHDYRMLKLESAAKNYMAALEKNPADKSVKNLLNFDELRRKVEGQPENLWARWQLGRLLSMQKRDGEAAAVLNELVAMTESPAILQSDPSVPAFRLSALQQLQQIYTRAGKPAPAAEYARLGGQLEAKGVTPPSE